MTDNAVSKKSRQSVTIEQLWLSKHQLISFSVSCDHIVSTDQSTAIRDADVVSAEFAELVFLFLCLMFFLSFCYFVITTNRLLRLLSYYGRFIIIYLSLLSAIPFLSLLLVAAFAGQHVTVLYTPSRIIL